MSAEPKSKEKKKDKAPAQSKANSNSNSNTLLDARDYVNPTPDQALKDFGIPMSESYEPQAVESAWDRWWEAQNLYKPDPNHKGENFVMVIPPPNVTGTLHLGHALTCAVEDAITRWNRMSGKNTIWVPGTDHAGIATQVVVEKRLMKEEKLSRHDLGREEFVKRVWQWKEENGKTIYKQIRRLGASVDWEHERFTMDAMLTKAVKEAFIRLHAQGLIYRSNRLVNWSCELRTAISSIEVEYVELTGPTLLKVPGYSDKIEFGVIHSFAYKVSDSEGKPTEEEIVVATTRIETMLGDVAVAVHPDDPRYKHLHGKRLIHPFVPTRYLTVVCDPVLVDMKFGTGCVKVTPAHDPNDFACGERLKLNAINIFTDDGHINENGGEKFSGKKRFTARVEIIKALTELKLYRGSSPNPMSLGLCSRSKDVVEPVLRPQWWVRCKSMADRSVAAVRTGQLEIIPHFHDKIWYNWLENIQDWCISRQLWWGHRIPAYFVELNGQARFSDGDDQAWIVAESESDAISKAAAKFKVDPKDVKVTQDPDVLDTWFSSGLFPFSVFGWPDNTPDLAKYYPGTLLETGHDILFFWVARMVMMGLALTNKLPFNKIYLHAMVRDKIGRKMSKSLGNVVDPLDVIFGITLQKLNDKLKTGNLDPAEIERAAANQKEEFPNGIQECGADALRFGLLSYLAQGHDINLNIDIVVKKRQFCNKLWNAVKFALLNFPSDFKPMNLEEIHKKLLASVSATIGDAWILHRLHETIKKMDDAWTSYEFSAATTAIQDFWVSSFCDVFVEFTKPIFRVDSNASPVQLAAKQLSLSILYVCIEHGLRLLHPLMPFLTEELYHRLPGALIDSSLISERVKTHGKLACGSIMIQPYPLPKETSIFHNEAAENSMRVVQDIIDSIRSARVSLGMDKSVLENIYIVSSTNELNAIVHNYRLDIATLAYASNVHSLKANESIPANCLAFTVNSKLEMHLPMAKIDVSSMLVKMENSLNSMKASVAALEEKVKNSIYQSKTAAEVKERDLNKLQADSTEITKNSEFIAKIKRGLSPEQLFKYINANKIDKETALNKLVPKLADLKQSLEKDPKQKKLKTQHDELELEISRLHIALTQINTEMKDLESRQV